MSNASEAIGEILSILFKDREKSTSRYVLRDNLMVGDRPSDSIINRIFEIAIRNNLFILSDSGMVRWRKGLGKVLPRGRKKIKQWLDKFGLFVLFDRMRTAAEKEKEKRKLKASEQAEKKQQSEERAGLAAIEAKEAEAAANVAIVAFAEGLPAVNQEIQDARESLVDAVQGLIKEELVVGASPESAGLIQQASTAARQLTTAQEAQDRIAASLSPPDPTPATPITSTEQKQERAAAAPSLPLAAAIDTPAPDERQFPEQVEGQAIEEKQAEEAVEPQAAAVAAELAVEELKEESKAPELEQVQVLAPEDLPVNLTAAIASRTPEAQSPRLAALLEYNQLLVDYGKAEKKGNNDLADEIAAQIAQNPIDIGRQAGDGTAERRVIKYINRKLKGPRGVSLRTRMDKLSAGKNRQLVEDIASARETFLSSVRAINPLIQRLRNIGGRLEEDGLTTNPQMEVPTSVQSEDVRAAVELLADEIKDEDIESLDQTTKDSIALLLSVVSVETMRSIWSLLINDPTSLGAPRIMGDALKLFIGRIVYGTRHNSPEADAAIGRFFEGQPFGVNIVDARRRSALVNFIISLVPVPADVNPADLRAAQEIIRVANRRVGAVNIVQSLRTGAGGLNSRLYAVVSRIYEGLGFFLPAGREPVPVGPSVVPGRMGQRPANLQEEFRELGLPPVPERKEREPAIPSQEAEEPAIPSQGEPADELKQEERVAGLGIADGIRAAIASGAVLSGAGLEALTKGARGVVDAIPAMPDIAANIRAANDAAGGGAAGLAARAGGAAQAILAASGISAFSALGVILLAYIAWKLYPSSESPPAPPTEEEIRTKSSGQGGSTTEFFKSEEKPVTVEDRDTAQIGPSSSWLRPEFNKLGVDVLDAQFALTPEEFENSEWNNFAYVEPVDTQNSIEIDNLFNDFIRYSGDLFKPRYQRPEPPPTRQTLDMTASKFNDQYQLSQAFSSKFDGAFTPYDSLSETFNNSVFASEWDQNILYNDNMLMV